MVQPKPSRRSALCYRQRSAPHPHLSARKGFTGALKSVAAGRIIEITEGKRFQRRDGCTNQVWQDSFKALPLWSSWMIWQKIDYIHANPVKARLVSSARNYRWSSFRDFYFNSGEPLSVDHDWWWSDDSEKLDKAMKEIGWGRLQDTDKNKIISGGKPPFLTCSIP